MTADRAPVTACHICGSPKVEELRQEGTPFRLVSSDVQPVSGTAEFSICPNCLAVQKSVTPAWHAMAEQIYAGYDINHQKSRRRTDDLRFGQRQRPAIADPAAQFPRYGCAGRRRPASRYRLRERQSAEELSQPAPVVEALGVRAARYLEGGRFGPSRRRALLQRAHAAYAKPFDVISLSHVLEHVPDPIAFLKETAGYLSERGRILLATPNLRQNPIDLIIADHCTHFDEDSLSYVAKEAGLSVELLSAGLLPKELVAVLARCPQGGTGRAASAVGSAGKTGPKERCLFYFTLLDDVRKAARRAVLEKRPFGIMGSSIAACWLMLELDGKVDFFVDEDPDRIGHELTGLPILRTRSGSRRCPGFHSDVGARRRKDHSPMAASVARLSIRRFESTGVIQRRRRMSGRASMRAFEGWCAAGTCIRFPPILEGF